MLPSGPKRYDAFLSYNSQDHSAVHEVAERLKAEGLEPYLDEWDMAPGREFQPALTEALHQSKTCVVFLGPNGLGPWQKQELQVAIDKRAREEAFHVIPVLLPGTERPRRGAVAHLEFLINASWVEFLKTLDDEQAFHNLVWGITGQPPEPDGKYEEGVCPYRGLEAFRPEDARFFFGRDHLTGWLVSALRREVRAAQGVRFLGVLGPSGSGKSSVVLAGLVPKLGAGSIEGSERWKVAILRPGDDPLKNLAVGVVPRFLPAGALPDAAPVLKLIDDLRADTRTLDVYTQMALCNQPDGVRLAIVVDQFEEVFTYRPRDEQARVRFEQDRASFFANLLQGAAAPGGRVTVVLTMRSDFLSASATFPQLAAVLSAHQELVGPMTAEELREAIEQPAFRVGCEVEPALTQRLLADVEGQPGSLPLLQFALTEVWKKRDIRRLTLPAYTELGKDDKGEPRGIEGVLDHRANEIYRNLNPENQDLCRWLFLRLVHPGEGTEDTKRRVSYRELLLEDPTRAEAVKRLVHSLADRDARLITTEGTDTAEGAVEVAHEALIQGWTQLRRWIDAERAGLRTQRRLTEAAGEWADARPEDKKDYLYSGVPLAVCREWAKTQELSAIEAGFLTASEEAEQNELENERRLREAAEAAQAVERKRAKEAEVAAERQRRLGFWLSVAAAVAGVLAVASVGLALWANKARNDANIAAGLAKENEAMAISARNDANIAAGLAKENEEKAKAQARLAESRRLAALSEAERDKRLDVALILAVEAIGADENAFEARDNFFRALLARPALKTFLHIGKGYIWSVAFSPDGTTLAAGYHGGVALWDTSTRTPLGEIPLTVPDGYVDHLAFSPDGKTLAAGYDPGNQKNTGGGVVLWNIDRREHLQADPIPVPDGNVTALAFGPDGNTLAVGYSVSRDGNASGGVVLWDVETRKPQGTGPMTVQGGVTGVVFDHPGKTLAASFGGGVVLWEIATRTRLGADSLAVSEGLVTGVAFSPDGKTLAARYTVTNARSGVALWDVPTRKPLGEVPLSGPTGEVTDLAFSPSGKTLALAVGVRTGNNIIIDMRGEVALWNLDVATRMPLEVIRLTVAEGGVTGLAFSPDRKTLATSFGGVAPSFRGGVALWDITTTKLLGEIRLTVAEGGVTGLAFSPDRKTLAVSYFDLRDANRSGGVVLWDATTRKPRSAGPMTLPGGVNCMAFDFGGTTLAVGYKDGVALWDVTTHKPLGAGSLPVPGIVRGVAFSPDGTTLAAHYDGSRDGKNSGGVVLWNGASRMARGTEPLTVRGRVSCVAFNSGVSTLAVGYNVGKEGSKARGEVELWDVATRTRLAKFPLSVSRGNVTHALAFSPDGKTLAAAYGDVKNILGGVALWDVPTRAPLGEVPLPVSDGGVTALAFSHDGKTLAAACHHLLSDRSGVVLFDVATRRRLGAGSLAVPGIVRGVAFSADGKTLAAAYGAAIQSGVVLWDVDLNSWKRLAGQIANRNLTRAEWRQYFPDADYRGTFKDLPEYPETDPIAAPAPTPAAPDVPRVDPE
jgi:WD40 repeat protein